MINEYKNISDVLSEAWRRWDGKVMFFCSTVSLFLFLWALLGCDIGGISNQTGKHWPFWSVMPLIQFLFYIRLRQYDLAGDGKVGQLVNALHLILAQFVSIYFLWG